MTKKTRIKITMLLSVMITLFILGCGLSTFKQTADEPKLLTVEIPATATTQPTEFIPQPTPTKVDNAWDGFYTKDSETIPNMIMNVTGFCAYPFDKPEHPNAVRITWGDNNFYPTNESGFRVIRWGEQLPKEAPWVQTFEKGAVWNAGQPDEYTVYEVPWDSPSMVLLDGISSKGISILTYFAVKMEEKTFYQFNYSPGMTSSANCDESKDVQQQADYSYSYENLPIDLPNPPTDFCYFEQKYGDGSQTVRFQDTNIYPSNESGYKITWYDTNGEQHITNLVDNTPGNTTSFGTHTKLVNLDPIKEVQIQAYFVTSPETTPPDGQAKFVYSEVYSSATQNVCPAETISLDQGAP